MLYLYQGQVEGCSNYSMNRPFRKSEYLLIGERTRTRAHSRRNSVAVGVLSEHNKIFIFPFPADVPSKLSSRFLSNCFMTQSSASSFGRATGANARWLGGESKIGSTTLSGSPLAVRRCKKCGLSDLCPDLLEGDLEGASLDSHSGSLVVLLALGGPFTSYFQSSSADEPRSYRPCL